MSCITLLSDFGLQDASLAAAKGILMQHVPEAQIIDVSHLVEPFHLQQAVYLLLASYPYFPKGTCHVLLFDIFSEKSPRLLLCEKDGHYFLAPDNGLLALAFGDNLEKVWTCYELTEPAIFKDWLHEAGRIARQLQEHGEVPAGLPLCALRNAPKHLQPLVDHDTVECHVIHIDRYENVVVNITREQFDRIGKGRSFRIHFMRDEEISDLSYTYFNVREGEKLCRFNATGFLEIAINRGRAASLFGFRLNREHHLIYSTIKIYFE